MKECIGIVFCERERLFRFFVCIPLELKRSQGSVLFLDQVNLLLFYRTPEIHKCTREKSIFSGFNRQIWQYLAIAIAKYGYLCNLSRVSKNQVWLIPLCGGATLCADMSFILCVFVLMLPLFAVAVML